MATKMDGRNRAFRPEQISTSVVDNNAAVTCSSWDGALLSRRRDRPSDQLCYSLYVGVSHYCIFRTVRRLNSLIIV